MADRVLMAATVPSMIGQFNMDNIRILQGFGYEVELAADFSDTSVWPAERTQVFVADMRAKGVHCVQIDYSRSPFDVHRHIKSYIKTKNLLRLRNYDFVHTHTPIASAIVRIAAHRIRTKVIYTAHGFHFYDGAPLKNWLVFYPVERLLSRWTDVLITINREDYQRAKNHFHAKRTVYVPGVGVDTEKFRPRQSGRKRIRKELGLKEADTMLLSVGELNVNKNHVAVIRAIEGLDLTYVVVGKGEWAAELALMAERRGVDLRLMGFREDVADFYNAADAYVLPSIREGLNVSIMEAMASGLPVACGRIRGNVDLVDASDGVLFNPKDEREIRKAIIAALDGGGELGRKNLEAIRAFDIARVMETTAEIYVEEGSPCLLSRQQ